MKESHRENDRLDQFLKAWTVDAPLPWRFQEQVWRRICREESVPALSWRAWCLEAVGLARAALLRPLGAAAYLTVLVAAGVTIGYWSSEHYAQETQSAWRTAYVRSVMPAVAMQP